MTGLLPVVIAVTVESHRAGQGTVGEREREGEREGEDESETYNNIH